ncbi:D-glycero-alpha-D-manno-heptose-1,7-bisphosphate 7-phosphatase [Streptomyces roseus]|uniref:D-glycero-alpha-D-manno-heptose-1,7-bisphosphate 7-phosphatase n=1 Tax=Streptomyces roseus TaxID=66430 RepID=UPI0036A71C02
MTGRPAVFLDRDGTVTEPRHYPTRPQDLVLQEGVGEALRELHLRGWALVIVTNQSGLARGLFPMQSLDSMHRHLRTLLAEYGVVLDAIYACPHHVDGAVDGLSFRCGCRKPQPGLLLWAAEELGLDLTASWMVGDFASDVEAGLRAGCRTAWVGRSWLEPLAGLAEPAGPVESAGPARPAGTAGEQGPVPTLRTATTAEALRHIVLSRP